MATTAERAMSFGTIAADYDRLRSGPAADALGWLLPDPCETVLDLAAGTGLLSRAVARRVPRVPRVVAVEPDGRMAGLLMSRSPSVSAVRGVGEALPVADASVDAVLISSAWHWLDPARAVPELARVLRDGGRLGLLWTGPDRETGWLRSLERPFRQYRQRDRPRLEMPASGSFGNVAVGAFTFTRLMTPDDFVAMLATYSALITATPADRDAELAHTRGELARLFPAGGPLEVPMRTRCWRADRLPRLAPNAPLPAPGGPLPEPNGPLPAPGGPRQERGGPLPERGFYRDLSLISGTSALLTD